jgi:hypothetical protein
MDWYMDGKIQIDPMITHRLSLGEINKGFDLMAARIASALCSSNDGGRGADAAAETASSPFAARGSRIARSRIVHWGIPADDLRRC